MFSHRLTSVFGESHQIPSPSRVNLFPRPRTPDIPRSTQPCTYGFERSLVAEIKPLRYERARGDIWAAHQQNRKRAPR